ncbi:MAG: doxX subfamily protein [Acidimicrobiales bacterium]|nr:doxX subfamily protein [Acidimicrobiales bacterium]
MNHVLADATYAADYGDRFDAILLLVRVLLGVVLAAHGYNKFFGGGKIPGTARWFDSMGMKPNGKVHAIMAATTEMGSGILLALGLLTPFAAAGYVGLMTVAGYTVHRKNGFFSAKSGWELNFVLAAAAVLVSSVSPGRHSLDWALGLDLSFDPFAAFAISVGLGLAGGIGLLVACYRPPAESGS